METPARTEVGIRELRDRFSQYLARVRKGEELAVTDRGHIVAYVVRRPNDLLAQLIAEGRATPPRTRTRSLPEPVEFKGTDEDLDEILKAQKR